MYLGKPVIGNFKPPREQRKRMKSPAEKREKDEAYLKLLRMLPCVVCGKPGPSEVHHLKQGTGERGAGKRSSDKHGVPLCNEHHINGVERVGSRKEQQWFAGHGIDKPLTLAAGLYANRHSITAMLSVLRAHREATDG